MAYNKEYYETHKEQLKKNRDKYRKGTPEALERTRKINRDRYNNLPAEKKKMLLEKQKARRQETLEATRIGYKINIRKKQIKQYIAKKTELENSLSSLKAKHPWEKFDFKYEICLNDKIKILNDKINKKHEEINVLTKEREALLNEGIRK